MSNGTGVKINLNNEKVIECTVKSLDLSHLLKAHERTSGNDYLYEFCRAHPIPKEIPDPQGNHSEKASDDLTPEEAYLADQMWLIGRSYAASPERYAYSRVKPTEKYLGLEGYESFFQDVARMFLRGKHDKHYDGKNPIAYFRGKPYIFDGRVDELEKKYNIENQEPEKKCGEEGQRLRKSAKEAFEKLGRFQVFQGELDSLKKRHYDVITSKDLPPNITNVFKKSDGQTVKTESDWMTAEKASDLVIRFAEQLNAARTLRDAAIICRSLENPSKKEEFQEDIKAWIKTVAEKTPSVSISFCSKFLHFHYPQLFFIYDSISSKRAKAGNLSEDYFGFRLQKNVKKSNGSGSVMRPSQAVRNWIKDNPKSDSKSNDESAKFNDEKYDDWLMIYQEHVINELIIAYAVYRYLDESKEDSKEQQEAKNKLREHLKACTNDQDDSHEKPCIPPRYLSITRLVDELVTNSSPENMEETKETD